jgi:hypothetical protein
MFTSSFCWANPRGGAGEADPTDDWSGLGRQRSNNYSYGNVWG